MGGVGSAVSTNVSSMSINDFSIEEKKWDKRQRANLERAISFMSNEFGDIKDLIGPIRRRTSSTINAAALYDYNGTIKGDRATYFATDNYAGEDTVIHEFTHAITEEIASHYKELGYNSRDDVLSAMRTEVHQNLGMTERKYDGRKWADRPAEFLSRTMEGNASDRQGGSQSKESLKVIKNWFRKVRK